MNQIVEYIVHNGMMKNYQSCTEGDKTRDASDKIRGFMFQDLVAIRCLLQNQVKYVCLEYLEDVDVFFEWMIHLKFHSGEILSPKTPCNERDINRSFYYQFLRCQILSSTLKVAPKTLYLQGKKLSRNQSFDENGTVYLVLEINF